MTKADWLKLFEKRLEENKPTLRELFMSTKIRPESSKKNTYSFELEAMATDLPIYSLVQTAVEIESYEPFDFNNFKITNGKIERN